jgi:ribosomal protein S18 acetylase RimI-like enzyme
LDTLRQEDTFLIQIRRAEPEERDRLRTFVQVIVEEVYGHLWSEPSSEDGSLVASRVESEDWSKAWVAFDGDTLVGTVLTQAQWIDDLWVSREYRGQGIGQQLLARGEAEIKARDYSTLRLRVVKTNSRAVRFYERLGWKVEKEFLHETLCGVLMLELSKPASAVAE